jgi:phage gp37-like protein
LDKNIKKASAKVERLATAMKHNEVGTLKEAQNVHQKYFDKTIGEYKSLAKARDMLKRKAMLADQKSVRKE